MDPITNGIGPGHFFSWGGEGAKHSSGDNKDDVKGGPFPNLRVDNWVSTLVGFSDAELTRQLFVRETRGLENVDLRRLLRLDDLEMALAGSLYPNGNEGLDASTALSCSDFGDSKIVFLA